MNGRGQERVALVLAGTLGASTIALAIAVLWDAIKGRSPGLGSNIAVVLVAAFVGIVALLGSYLGKGWLGPEAVREQEELHDEPPPWPATSWGTAVETRRTEVTDVTPPKEEK